MFHTTPVIAPVFPMMHVTVPAIVHVIVLVSVTVHATVRVTAPVYPEDSDNDECGREVRESLW